MTLHKLSARSGYEFLNQQVAAGDAYAITRLHAQPTAAESVMT